MRIKHSGAMSLKTDLTEELAFMKIIKSLIFISAFSFNVIAAFTGPETGQLDKVNQSSIEKRQNAEALFNKKIDETTEHFPERMEIFVDLKKSWKETIIKKCQVKIFESINTDAEISSKNKCLSEEYEKAAKFFDELND